MTLVLLGVDDNVRTKALYHFVADAAPQGGFPHSGEQQIRTLS